MRLTKKEQIETWYKRGNVMMNCSLSLYEKLQKLEDIEDELGIDLITLFKVLNSRELYKKGVFTDFLTEPKEKIVKKEFYQIYLINFINAKEMRIEIAGNSYHEALWFDEYGKTWALTKEELEK